MQEKGKGLRRDTVKELAIYTGHLQVLLSESILRSDTLEKHRDILKEAVLKGDSDSKARAYAVISEMEKEKEEKKWGLRYD